MTSSVKTTPRVGAAINDIFTEDCVFYEPKGVYRSRDEIDRIAGAFKATHTVYLFFDKLP